MGLARVDEIARLISKALDLHKDAEVVECLAALNKVETAIWGLWRASAPRYSMVNYICTCDGLPDSAGICTVCDGRKP